MYPRGFYYYDWTYILVLIGAVLSMIASANVSATFKKYSRYASRNNMTGAMAADRILRSNGIYDVQIAHISGSLSDHYDPMGKVLRLSDSVYGSTSVAAIGVAAHECGHAIQHARGYLPLKIRSALVPVANISSQLSWIVIMAGIILGFTPVARLGVLLFCAVVLFQLITLPVEFDASRRGLKILRDGGLLYDQEARATAKVLRAAALTYVASVAASLLQLLRLIMIVNNSSRRRR